MIRNVIVEHASHVLGESVVRFDLDVPQSFPDRKPVPAEQFPLRDPVDFSHETPGVVGKGVVSFLELVQFFHDRDRDHQVVVLEFSDRLVVMQDDVRVEHENLRTPVFSALREHIRVFSHWVMNQSVFSFGGLAVQQ